MNHYVLYNPQGGSEGHSQQYSTQICIGLLLNGVHVHLVTTRDYDASLILKRGAKVSFTKIGKFQAVMFRYNSWLSKLHYGWVLLRSNQLGFRSLSGVVNIKESVVCLLIGGEPLTNSLYILRNLWRRNTVYALTIHNADYDRTLYCDDRVKFIYKMLSKFALKVLLRTRTIVFVHGEAMRDALSIQLKTSQDRISIYKVPTAESFLHSKSVQIHRAKRPIRLLFCGVMRYDKGYDLLCEALSKFKSQIDWQLRVAGSVRQVGEDYIRNLPKRYGISENFSFNLKYLSSDELDTEFQNCDIVVLPYRRSFVAQSVVFTDAIRWGKPVIVSAHSQNGYDAAKYNLGWIFESENIESLVIALQKALQDYIIHNTKKFGFINFMNDHSPYQVGRSIIVATSD